LSNTQLIRDSLLLSELTLVVFKRTLSAFVHTMEGGGGSSAAAGEGGAAGGDVKPGEQSLTVCVKDQVSLHLN
jgi:hypothetical protein